MPTLRRAFRLEKPIRGAIAGSGRPESQALISAWDLLGCHGISSVKWASAVPQTGSALNHLVTAVSVKKALMGRLQSPAPRARVPTEPFRVLPANAGTHTPRPLNLSAVCDDHPKPQTPVVGSPRSRGRIRGKTRPGDASGTHSDKMRGRGRLLHCAGGHRKGIVNAVRHENVTLPFSCPV